MTTECGSSRVGGYYTQGAPGHGSAASHHERHVHTCIGTWYVVATEQLLLPSSGAG